MMRGRWLASKSARRYIQSGQALLLAIQSPDSVLDLGDRLVALGVLAALTSASARALRGDGSAAAAHGHSRRALSDH